MHRSLLIDHLIIWTEVTWFLRMCWPCCLSFHFSSCHFFSHTHAVHSVLFIVGRQLILRIIPTFFTRRLSWKMTKTNHFLCQPRVVSCLLPRFESGAPSGSEQMVAHVSQIEPYSSHQRTLTSQGMLSENIGGIILGWQKFETKEIISFKQKGRVRCLLHCY